MAQQFCSSCGAALMPSIRVCPSCGGRSFAATPPQVFSPPLSPSNASISPQAANRQPVSHIASYSARDSGPADRGTRLGAVLLDIVIFGLCLAPGLILISIESSVTSISVGVIVLALSWLAAALVQIVMMVQSGQSIGKRMLGIKIVKVVDGSVPGFVKIIILRSLVPYLIAGIPFAGAAVILADSLMIFRDDRRCLHDIIAETKVVKV